MSVDLILPTFGLDCRDWLVATEAEGLLIDDADGAPVIAVLSTAVIAGAELTSARAVLSLALINDDPLTAESGLDAGADDGSGLTDTAGSTRSAMYTENWAGQDICVIDADWAAGYACLAVPTPGGELAIVAEFTSAPDPSRELVDRFYDLVTSFRWAA